jgi:hypothetical protein
MLHFYVFFYTIINRTIIRTAVEIVVAIKPFIITFKIKLDYPLLLHTSWNLVTSFLFLAEEVVVKEAVQCLRIGSTH